MMESILEEKLRILAEVVDIEKRELISKEFLAGWKEVSKKYGVKVQEKILVYKDEEDGRVFIHGFYYHGNEFHWFERVKESMVYVYEVNGELMKDKQIDDLQKNVFDFIRVEVNISDFFED